MTWLDREDGGYDVFFNRDERRTRLPAAPPSVRTVDGTRMLAPTDGDFGGSWLAVNERGLVVALLNGAVGSTIEDPRATWTSRGLLVRALAGSSSTADAIARLERTDLARYRAFVLVLLDLARDRRTAIWSERTLVVDPAADVALPIVSSSFDSAEVARGRRERFRALAAETWASPAELHRAYHKDHAPERGPRSVCMHRPDAETVSFSRIEVEPRAIRFLYWPVSPCRATGDPVAAELARPGSLPPSAK
jgi:hypothetical protein